MIRNMICREKSTVLEVMKRINTNAKGVAFIIDDNKKLCGVITDGDIRRFLLQSNDLQGEVSKLVKPNFVYAKEDDSAECTLSKLSDKIKVIPLVDKDFRVIDFIEDRTAINLPIAEPDLTGNELKYLIDAFLSTRISNSGEYVTKFEEGFSRFCECKYGVSVCNGTAALHLALMTLGIGEGDEVIVPELTFASTINAVLHARAIPVILDIDKESWCIDPREIEKAITKRTKAVIPVHLYGQPCDMASIMAITRKYGIFVIEDCAEAHGAKFNGKRVGSFGDIGCFSFYGNKIITTGEGGMCVMNSVDLNDKMRILRDHGISRNKKYWHEMVGYNYRLTNLQSAIGVAQLERIEKILSARKEIENDYRRYLSDIAVLEFQKDDLPKRERITWLVSMLVKDGKRDNYITQLKEKGIDVRNFFYPLSQMDIYKKYAFSNNKNSREISRKGISFPTVSKYLIGSRIGEIKAIFSTE